MRIEIIERRPRLHAVEPGAHALDLFGEAELLAERRHIFFRTANIGAQALDFFIERAKLLESYGYNEWLLGMDGMPHDQIMSCIELIGRHVIPACS